MGLRGSYGPAVLVFPQLEVALVRELFPEPGVLRRFGVFLSMDLTREAVGLSSCWW